MPHTPAAALRHLARSIAVVALGVLVLGVATLGQVRPRWGWRRWPPGTR
jgi:hypothetical protein